MVSPRETGVNLFTLTSFTKLQLNTTFIANAYKLFLLLLMKKRVYKRFFIYVLTFITSVTIILSVTVSEIFDVQF